ncbi:hypothetical protein PV413_17570, partial [Streptomyces scabiei]|nr:hypothetical protein [Streptomyces scabiei]
MSQSSPAVARPLPPAVRRLPPAAASEAAAAGTLAPVSEGRGSGVRDTDSAAYASGALDSADRLTVTVRE